MYVKSPIADMKIDIKTVSVQGRYIVVKSNDETSLPTTVYITPSDFWAFVRALFVSRLLFYIVTYPIQYVLYKMGIGADVKSGANNTNAQDTHPTPHPW